MLLIRHPETLANIEGRWTGRGDTPLTALGELQVTALGFEIAGFAPDAVHSSPLGRCRVVAEEVSRLTGVAPVYDPRLRELDFGAAEGLTFDEARERGIQFDFMSELAPVAEGGESRREILGRTTAALDDALASGHDRIAVIAHGGVFRSALVHLLGLPFSGIWAFHIRNAAYAEVRLIEGHGALERFGQVRVE